VEAELRALRGRPHWGKMHWRTAADLRPVYPRFDEFVTTRDAVDPDRVFGNTYLETVLGR
jgi:L-gulono-1,4-lactone dehydrogenase